MLGLMDKFGELRSLSSEMPRKPDESILIYWKRVQDAYARLSYESILNRVTSNVRAVRGTDRGPIDKLKS